jgi:hypothetical protein
MRSWYEKSPGLGATLNRLDSGGGVSLAPADSKDVPDTVNTAGASSARCLPGMFSTRVTDAQSAARGCLKTGNKLVVRGQEPTYSACCPADIKGPAVATVLKSPVTALVPEAKQVESIKMIDGTVLLAPAEPEAVEAAFAAPALQRADQAIVEAAFQADAMSSLQPVVSTPLCQWGTIVARDGHTICAPAPEAMEDPVPPPECVYGSMTNAQGVVTCLPQPDAPLPTCAEGQLFDPSTGACVTPAAPPSCPSGQLYDTSTGTCVTPAPSPDCPPDMLYDVLSSTCVALPLPPTCPPGQLYNTVNGSCVTPMSPPSCPPGQLFDTVSGVCVAPASPPSCPSGYLFDPAAGVCVAPASAPAAPSCPSGQLFDTILGTCVAPASPPSCPAGELYDTSLGLCVKPSDQPPYQAPPPIEEKKTNWLLWGGLAAGAGLLWYLSQPKKKNPLPMGRPMGYGGMGARHYGGRDARRVLNHLSRSRGKSSSQVAREIPGLTSSDVEDILLGMSESTYKSGGLWYKE